MHGALVERYRAALVPQARLSVESMLAGYASGMMQLDEVFMALDRALTVENDYEQQQIHYLHVLADLQVATAGVFDPAPHLQVSAPPLAEVPSAAARGGLALAPPVEDGLALPPVPVDDDPLAPGAGADATAGPAAPFVEELGLPPADAAAAADASGEQDASGVQDASGFYQPFVPGGKGDE
jgi:hypothetical protein